MGKGRRGRFHGRTIAITGGRRRGIGKATAAALAGGRRAPRGDRRSRRWSWHAVPPRSSGRRLRAAYELDGHEPPLVHRLPGRRRARPRSARRAREQRRQSCRSHRCWTRTTPRPSALIDINVHGGVIFGNERRALPRMLPPRHRPRGEPGFGRRQGGLPAPGHLLRDQSTRSLGFQRRCGPSSGVRASRVTCVMPALVNTELTSGVPAGPRAVHKAEPEGRGGRDRGGAAAAASRRLRALVRSGASSGSWTSCPGSVAEALGRMLDSDKVMVPRGTWAGRARVRASASQATSPHRSSPPRNPTGGRSPKPTGGADGSGHQLARLRVDEILGADQAVALAHVTPAHGVVLSPVTKLRPSRPASAAR